MRAATPGPDHGSTGKILDGDERKAIELRELWRRYKSEGDRRARERLVVAYSPLVKYVAGRTAAGLPPHVEEADLISYGLLDVGRQPGGGAPGERLTSGEYATTSRSRARWSPSDLYCRHSSRSSIALTFVSIQVLSSPYLP